jgi:hypothetical protein
VIEVKPLCALLTCCALGACSKSDPPLLNSIGESSAPPARLEDAGPSPPAEPPWVELSGRARQPFQAGAVGPRLYSRAMRTWIYEAPTHKSPRVGYLRAGSSSATAAAAVGNQDCKEGWYPVQPRGFVCLSRRATLDEDDPIVRATRQYLPNHQRKLPYIYGTVRRAGPIYGRLPEPSDVEQAEPDIDERMQTWLAAPGETGAGYAQDVWLAGAAQIPDPRALWQEKRSDPLPEFLRNHASTPNMYKEPRAADELVLERVRPRAGYAFVETVVFQGRRYGITPDLKLLPTDRLRPIRGSDFHGVELGKDIDFPFAFVRRQDAKLWLFQGGSRRLLDAGGLAYREAVKLTGKQRFFGGRLHYETQDGKWLSDRDGSRLDPARRMPAWGKNGEKWLDVNVTKQTLVLYEGTKPVYATLISTGEAGLEDPEHTTATKRGIFRIHTKHVSTTMSSDEVGEEFELREVPYVQYFDKQGYALHGAYWHDRFGTPKSHGCINLAPEDARRIFYFTEPQVPMGWHGALLPLKGSVLFVHP